MSTRKAELLRHLSFVMWLPEIILVTPEVTCQDGRDSMECKQHAKLAEAGFT